MCRTKKLATRKKLVNERHLVVGWNEMELNSDDSPVYMSSCTPAMLYIVQSHSDDVHFDQW